MTINKTRCNCKKVQMLHKSTLVISSNCFVHSPESAKHNARLDRMIKKHEKKANRP